MKWMIVQVVLLCTLAGCGEETGAQLNTKVVNFGEEFELEVNQKAVVTGNGLGEVTDSVLVEAVTMQDGRCPKGNECIRAGNIHLRILISNRNQADSIATCIGGNCGIVDEDFRNPNKNTEIDTTGFSLNNRYYKLIFKDAVPFPKVDGKKSNNGAERAILEVIRQ